MSLPGRIGSYEIEGLVGDGGMGAVYRARDPRFDRAVAIKVLHDQFLRDAGIVQRFKAEAVIQARLSHPNIVTVLDFISDDRALAIVMEYVDGLTLAEAIRESRGPMPPERVVPLMDQVLSAMAFAHSRGLVHRDLKPSNILVQSFDGREHAKVMDFGIAKILGSEKLRTATGAKMGTLAYMSPEHVRSPKLVDARSDVYSLGVVLHEMLSGAVPFDADSEFELMRQIVEQPPARIVLPAGGAGGRLHAVVERALAKQPSDRFQTCQQMREALSAGSPASLTAPLSSAADAPRQVEAPMSVQAPPAAPQEGRRAQAALVASLALCGLAAGGALLSWVSGSPDQPAQRPQTPVPAPASTPSTARRSRSPVITPTPLAVTFRVVRVASNDVLYLRESPNHKSFTVGALPPDARGILWHGEQSQVGRFTWYRLTWNGAVGWANGAFLERE